jgi:hypothetical protein
LLGTVREAGRYGLYDLDRLERMILRGVTREYFLLEMFRRTFPETDSPSAVLDRMVNRLTKIAAELRKLAAE